MSDVANKGLGLTHGLRVNHGLSTIECPLRHLRNNERSGLGTDTEEYQHVGTVDEEGP